MRHICNTGCKDTAGIANVQKARPGATILPLPRILNHASFRRSSVSLGRCLVCGEGAILRPYSTNSSFVPYDGIEGSFSY